MNLVAAVDARAGLEQPTLARCVTSASVFRAMFLLPKRLIAAHLRVNCLLSGCCALELVAVVIGEHWVAPSKQVEAFTRALEASVVIAGYQKVFQVQQKGRRVPNIDLKNLFVSSVFAVKMPVQVLVLSDALLDLQAY